MLEGTWAKGMIVTTCSRAAFSVGIANSAAAADADPLGRPASSPLKDVVGASPRGGGGQQKQQQQSISDYDG